MEQRPLSEQIDVPDGPQPAPPQNARRRAAAPVIASTIVAVLFAVIFLAALGAPQAHEVPVAVVGSERAADEVQRALDDEQRGGFDVQAVADEAAGRNLLEAREVYAVAGDDGVLVSSFNGAPLNDAIQSTLAASVAVEGAGDPEAGASTRPVTDLHDGEGKPGAIFYAVFGMVIGAMVLTVVSGAAMTPHHPFREIVLTCAAAALLVGGTVTLAVQAFDSLPGNYLQVFGVLSLLMFALGLTVQGITRVLGLAGLPISAIFFIMIGNAASGAAVHPLLLADGWRQLSPLIPTGAATTAVLDVAAFDGANPISAIAVLCAWIAFGLLLVVTASRRGAQRALPLAETRDA